MIISTRSCGRTLLFLVFGSFLVILVTLYQRPDNILSRLPGPFRKGSIAAETDVHPIDALITQASNTFDALLEKRTKDVVGAAAAYRSRRGRHPPPLFDEWVEFALEKESILVEDFFDQIYHDLNPFWGVPPHQLLDAQRDWPYTINVRNGNATFITDTGGEWMGLWHNLVQTIADRLPDVDIAINEMDESRVLAPWETVNMLVAAGSLTKHTRTPTLAHPLVSKYQTLEDPSEEPSPDYRRPNPARDGAYWSFYRETCPPDSDARSASVEGDYSKPVDFPTTRPYGSFRGYVSNWTVAKDPCRHPHLRNMHGTFVEPLSMSTITTMHPLFGGSKLPGNNEILLPPAMYWTKDPFYSGGKEHGGSWEGKSDGLIWRGSASGGRNKKGSWRRFQRHRFVSMANGTQISAAEADAKLSTHPDDVSPSSAYAHNFALPSTDVYHIPAAEAQSLGPWVDTFADAAFVHLLCFPAEGKQPNPNCSYTSPYFVHKVALPMKDQYAHKYLPDIDGNSFSGRYRGFLLSTSLPIKASIYSEWHDSRLIPWRHYVPMDNTYADFWAIMHYFLGWAGTGLTGKGAEKGHDEQARQIAQEGKRWAELVLRREDMQVYVYRLLLEWARVCDERREGMGWADDLTA